jgi:hypothetical protein
MEPTLLAIKTKKGAIVTGLFDHFIPSRNGGSAYIRLVTSTGELIATKMDAIVLMNAYDQSSIEMSEFEVESHQIKFDQLMNELVANCTKSFDQII